jgi:hypothetical protein
MVTEVAVVPAVAAAGRLAVVRQLVASGITCMFANPGPSEENLLHVPPSA